MTQPVTSGLRGSCPLSHNYFLWSTGTEGTPLPGSLGQQESQISDQIGTCCISGFTLVHPPSSSDKEPPSPSQLTSRGDGPTEQTAYTSVTTRIMNVGSQYTMQPLPDPMGQRGHATDTPSNQPAQLRPETENPTLVSTRVDNEPINPLTVRSVSEPNSQTSSACDNLSMLVAKLTTLTATLSNSAPSLMAPCHVFTHDDEANYSTDRNFITNRTPDMGDDMANVCLPPHTLSATHASQPGQQSHNWPIVAEPDHFTSASRPEQCLNAIAPSTASIDLRPVSERTFCTVSRPGIYSRAITNLHSNVTDFDQNRILTAYDSDTSEPASDTPLISNPRKRPRVHDERHEHRQPTVAAARDPITAPTSLPLAEHAFVAPAPLDQVYPANGLRRPTARTISQASVTSSKSGYFS